MFGRNFREQRLRTDGPRFSTLCLGLAAGSAAARRYYRQENLALREFALATRTPYDYFDMIVEEHIKAGQLDEALAFAQEAVRKTPAEARPRILLFQLLSVLGQWERALTQLNVLRDMDPECMVLAEIFRPALQCEALRKEIFCRQTNTISA